MFPTRYFASRYFAQSYWAKVGAAATSQRSYLRAVTVQRVGFGAKVKGASA